MATRSTQRSISFGILRCVLIFLLLFILQLSVIVAADDFRTLDGKTANPGDYPEKIIVLNFWATWCVPCREEMPLFVESQKTYAASGVQFIAVSLDSTEDLDKVIAFTKEFRLNFPVWMGASENQTTLGLGTGLPATAIFDRNGNLCFRIIGKSTRKGLGKRIDYLLSADARSKPDPLVLPSGITKEHFEKFHAHGDSEEEHHHEDSAGSEVPS